MQPLGVGGTGETFLCKRKDTGEEEAVKIIKRPIPMALKTLITNEITLQASIGEGNINIVHAHSVILTKTHLCLFMDFISGGTLTDYVSDRADTVDQRNGLFLDEDEARFLFTVRIPVVVCVHESLSVQPAGPRQAPRGYRTPVPHNLCTQVSDGAVSASFGWRTEAGQQSCFTARPASPSYYAVAPTFCHIFHLVIQFTMLQCLKTVLQSFYVNPLPNLTSLLQYTTGTSATRLCAAAMHQCLSLIHI